MQRFVPLLRLIIKANNYEAKILIVNYGEHTIIELMPH